MIKLRKQKNNNMKKFVSFNLKYYKKEQMKILSDHNERLHQNIKNIHDKKLTPLNKYFYYDQGDSTQYLPYYSFLEENGLKPRFDHFYKEYKKILGKKPRKDFNCFLDGVLAFSEDKFNEVYKEDPQAIEDALTTYLERVSKDFGFTPLGWALHLDEGHTDGDGNYKINVHAHMSFFNYDFENRKSTLKSLKKKDFKKMQDIAGEIFGPLGFERGISKEITQKKHLEKSEFVAQKTKEKIKFFKELKARTETLEKKQSKLLELEYDLTSDPKPKPKFLKRLKVQFLSLFSKKQKQEIKDWEAYQVKLIEQRLLKEEIQSEKEKIKSVYSIKMSNERKSKSRYKPSIKLKN